MSKRIGSVPYLNSVPLTCGIEDETLFVVPSKLADMLRTGELDAALVSITEILFHEGYDILDGAAIASRGEVKSVFLAHRQPLEEIEVIHSDSASLTSVNLLRVLLAERGLYPKFEPLSDYSRAALLQNVLLIGNPGINFVHAPHDHAIWDLGTAWHELTHLPFVYAVWALRRGHHDDALREKLRAAKVDGLARLEQTICDHPEYDSDFRRAYLGSHIHYELEDEEKTGLARFIELLKKHQDQNISDPTFV
jgi:chorismate dehydratase